MPVALKNVTKAAATKAAASKTTKGKPAKAKAPRGKVGAPKAASPSKGTTGSSTAQINGKGYDPKIPVEDRNEAEKLATIEALNAQPSADELKARADKEKAAKATKGKTRGDSLISRISQVLSEADGPMHVKDIVAAVEKKFGKDAYSEAPTPKTTRTQVQCDSAKKRGLIVRTDKATFDLAELNPKGLKTRPKK